ncbi:MAG: acyl-CoA reductase-like NAD-dependent aldehyde dehydrogenase [Motiliproteus sp.]|jgi:acyl-CoA reductase-like NAD-dependent aldehyde dehydrogenase
MAKIRLDNPFTGEPVFEQESETFAQVAGKLVRARAAYSRWSRVPPAERAALVRKALDRFREAEPQICTAIANEMGKPTAAAAQELAFMLERAEYMCSFAAEGALQDLDMSGEQQPDFEGSIRFRGKGLVYIISPWNYPLFTAINGVICALLSGSTVILKHTTTPAVGRLFEDAFKSMGKFDDLLFNITTDYAVSADIIEQGDINHVVFTGSVQGGQVIQQSVAKRALNEQLRSPFIEVSLELGSNDACYIAEDADLEQAVLWAVTIGRLHNSGQSCCAVKRVYVHAALHDAFLEKAKAVMEAQVNGDPLSETTTLGPLFGGGAAIDGLLSLVEDARARGASIVTGGERETLGGCAFIQPTLVSGVDHQMRIMTEETFGPVLPVMKVTSDAQAFELIADTRYGLTAALFTRSRARVGEFLEALDFGTLYVNRCNFVDARLGWIGHRHSGNGSLALSPEGLRAFSSKTSINIDGSQLGD